MVYKDNTKKSPLLSVREYLNNKPYIIILVLSVVASYLFFVTHPSVSNDDLSRERYVFDGYIAAQGRFTGIILNVLLDTFGVNTGVIDFLGIVFLTLSAIVFCVLFDRVYTTENKLPQLLFSCFFVTFPLHAEVFVYAGCTLSVGLGMFLVSVALLTIICAVDEKSYFAKSAKNTVIATVLLMFVASWYESVLFVYYGAVFALLILKMLSQKSSKDFNFRSFVVFGLSFALPLVLAVLSEFIVQTVVVSLSDTHLPVNANNTVAFAISAESLVGLVKSCVAKWALPALYYLPVTVFDGAVITGAIVFLVLSLRKRDVKYLLAFIGLVSSAAINTVLTMTAAPYRTAQPTAFIVGFIAFAVTALVLNYRARFSLFLSRAVVALLVLICVNQVTEINYWFNLEEMRYQNEKQTVEQIAFKLNSEFDTQKPVVFTGSYTVGGDFRKNVYLSEDSLGYKAMSAVKTLAGIEQKDKAYRIPQTICVPYITWSIEAFDEVNTELLKFFSYLGYDFKQGTQEMYNEALVVAEDLPEWPKDGSIVDKGDYILVNFGGAETYPE